MAASALPNLVLDSPSTAPQEDSLREASPAIGRNVKAVPTEVKRRRPSLASVLTDDPATQSYQQQLARKVHQAAVALASDTDGRLPELGVKARRCGGSTDESLDGFVMLAVVAFVAVLFCVLIAVQKPLTEGVVGNFTDLVEGQDSSYQQHFDLNEPIGAFIGVMAFIFALLYTSTYNDAQQRLSSIRNSLAQEAGGVHTAMLLVRTLDADDNVNKMRALLLFSSYIENLATELYFKAKPSEIKVGTEWFASSIESLYAAIPFLAEIGSDGEGDEMDRVLIQRTVDALNRVCEARHSRISEERHAVSSFTFAFLSMLSLFTFYGTLFLQFGSKNLNLSVVIMTAVSLVVAMTVLMDVALPWRGFITVDTGIFTSIRQDISLVLEQEDVQDAPDGLEEDETDLHGGRDESTSPRNRDTGGKSVRLADRGRMESSSGTKMDVGHKEHLSRAIIRRGSMCEDPDEISDLNQLRVQ